MTNNGIWTIRVSPSLQVLEAWHDAQNHGRKPGFRCFDVDGNLVWVEEGDSHRNRAVGAAKVAAMRIRDLGLWGNSEVLRQGAM